MTVASKDYSVKLQGESALIFSSGFSVKPATKLSETSMHPFKNQRNIFTVFVSKPDLIKHLTHVEIKSFRGTLTVPLKMVAEGVYATEPFDIPKSLFNANIFGVDKSGSLVERVGSKGLGDPVHGCKSSNY